MIVVPDDFPSVFEDSAAHEHAKKLGDVRVFTERGADDEAELIRRIGDSRIALNIRAHARFNEAVFRACPKLKMISIWGTGTDNVDLEAAARYGVTVCNIPGVNAIAVAEHTIMLMLAVARKVTAIDRKMRAGEWPREMLMQLHGKTLGVFGTGAIGKRVVELGRALGMTVLPWSARGQGLSQNSNAAALAKDEILKRADIISLHLRLTPETRGFLGRREFALMKPEAILVNTARGALVEREALLESLERGTIAGVGLDVFHDEPLKPDDPLLRCTNTVLSPHNAGQTPEVRRDGLLLAVENIERFLAGKPANVVTP